MRSAHGGLVRFSPTTSMASNLTRCVYLIGSGYGDHGGRRPHGVAEQHMLAAVAQTAATPRDVGRPTGITSWPLHPTYSLSLSPISIPSLSADGNNEACAREEQDLCRCRPQVHGGGFFSSAGSIHGQTRAPIERRSSLPWCLPHLSHAFYLTMCSNCKNTSPR
jgi:hypothetical protein